MYELAADWYRFQEYYFPPWRLEFLNRQVVFKYYCYAPSREDILSKNQIFGIEEYGYQIPHGHFTECSEVVLWKHPIWIFLNALIGPYRTLLTRAIC